MSTNSIDFSALKFGYTRTPANVRCYWRNGEWGPIEVHTSEDVSVHMAATVFHYGQSAFEGLKAFSGVDGKIRIFRMEENAKRMQLSAEYLRMAPPTIDLFCEMVRRVVELNADFVPPYECNGSLYIRPVIVGTGPQVGVKPAGEYLLLIFATPVGPYYSGGLKGIEAIVDRTHDRAAPYGTGHTKAGGNYGASLTSAHEAHEKGYDSVVYLDPATHTNIDECGAANFFGIKDLGNGRSAYVTPVSNSILQSITNMSLSTLAADAGLEVERRIVPLTELAEFSEAGCCGTAAVLTPLTKVFDPADGKTYSFPSGAGPWSQRLYDTLTGIQRGELPDTYGWTVIL